MTQATHSSRPSHTAFLAAIAAFVVIGCAAAPEPAPAPRPREDNPAMNLQIQDARQVLAGLRDRYNQTPAWDRVWIGGLAACTVLALFVTLERMIYLRRRRVLPFSFEHTFLERLRQEKLDAGKALDYCELAPNPAGRVALAAVRRWGRPTPDLERAVAIAVRIETDQLRRNVATLRRVALLAPLIGLLGSLTTIARALAQLIPGSPMPWNSAVAHSLGPVIAGVALGTIAFVLFDGLMIKVEKLSGALDRLGAETVDAIAMATPVPTALPPQAPPQPHPENHPRAGYRTHFPSARAESAEPRRRHPVDDEY